MKFGQFCENLVFCKKLFNQSSYLKKKTTTTTKQRQQNKNKNQKQQQKKNLLQICNPFNCDYLPHTSFRFYLIDFQLNADFPTKFSSKTFHRGSVHIHFECISSLSLSVSFHFITYNNLHLACLKYMGPMLFQFC